MYYKGTWSLRVKGLGVLALGFFKSSSEGSLKGSLKCSFNLRVALRCLIMRFLKVLKRFL